MNPVSLSAHRHSKPALHKRFGQLLLVAAFALMLAPMASADERRQPLVLKNLENPGVSVPSRGHTMSRVEADFGEPESRHGPVGDPPITRWQYPEFRVVFEGRYVIHTVVEPTDD